MTKVIVGESLRAQLPSLAERIEFCDEAGKTLGRFLPEDVYRELVRACAGHISEEEIERRRREPRGRTLAEIWKSLGQE
jgi:hypothetical protein